MTKRAQRPRMTDYGISIRFEDGTRTYFVYATDKGAPAFSEIRNLVSSFQEHAGKTIVHCEAKSATKSKNVIYNQDSSEEDHVEPPALAEFLCALFVKDKHKIGILGDLSQDFSKNVREIGEARAKRRYWADVSRAIGPLLLRWLHRVAWSGLAVAIGKWFGA